MTDAIHPAAAAGAIAARIERIPFVGWHIRTRLIVGIATFFNGFDMLAIAYALPVLAPLWHLTPAQSGLLLSALFLGELVGAPMFALLAERYGRRPALIMCTALFSVMSIASGFAWSYTSLLALRFLVGVGLGAEVPIAVSYISEISKAHGRGRFILLYELIFPVGLVLAGLMGWWIVAKFGWRPLLIMGGAPAIMILFMQRYLPESPRWLAQRHRFAEADAVVTRIEQAAERSTGKPLPPPAAVSITAAAPEKPSWRDLFAPPYLSRTIVLWIMYFGCFSINFGLTSWLPSLYTTVFHLDLDTALRNTLITQAVGFLGTLTAAMLIDKLPRRIWFSTAFVLSAIMLAVIWRLGADTVQLLLVGGCAAYFFVSTISISLILYAPELYPTRARAIGVATGYMMSVLGGAVAPMVVGAVVAGAGLATVFAIFSAVALIAGVLTMILATETRGRVLEEISP